MTTAKNKKFERMEPEEIPEVKRYMELKEQWEAFKAANKAFFDYAEPRMRELNEARDEAERVVKSKGVSCGPFEIYQSATTYNAEEMFNIFGREEFLKLGGSEERVVKYNVDKARVDLHIANGEIDEESAARIRKISPRYRKVEGAE